MFNATETVLCEWSSCQNSSVATEPKSNMPFPKAERRFDRFIGNSAALESVLDQVEQVAPTDSTVLIEGETGTGKELIAHAIHNESQRCGRAFIKLNCAAIPLGLLESELFGHEKGAFTGAIAQKIGRFEMADKETLFLDEVGDIPPALQPKLLRVLQEQEFERLGSGRTHKVDVRLVAATNRNLVKMVVRGQFRSDLYYRLNVFPILLPALRERREDIPALVTHFVTLFNRDGEASQTHSSGNHGCLQVVLLAWQHTRVTELGGTRRYPFARRCAPKPTSQKPNRAHDPQSASHPN
jgi:transcriptional regulator with GAF, ATPase, and Fis domain